MNHCVNCGSELPENHRHKTCSMCYGDIDYGTDGYYRKWEEQQEELKQEREKPERG